MTEKSIAAARRLVSQDNVNRASLLLLVIAIGWSIYAAFSLLWNDYLFLGSINVIEVIASLGLRHWPPA